MYNYNPDKVCNILNGVQNCHQVNVSRLLISDNRIISKPLLSMKYDKYGETDNAKQCALICVDEIVNLSRKHLVQSISFYEYWIKVKQEIELL